MSRTESGRGLSNGEDHRPDEVQRVMQILWARFVDANPKLFEI
jgi:hypothetical protein